MTRITRRGILGGAASVACATMAGIPTPAAASPYLAKVVRPENQNTVFYWLDRLMQQTRDQRVAPPRASYNFAMPLAAGFLAANGITRTYAEDFGIGPGPTDADPEAAYGAALAYCAAEVYQQPFIAARRKFFSELPNTESVRRGISWGRAVGRKIVKMRTNDGSEESEVNYYFDDYPRRRDALQWTPTGPFYSTQPGPAFGTFARGLFPGHGRIKPWTMTSGGQFATIDFPDAESPEFAAAFEEVKQWGGRDSTIRTEDEAEIAIFWEDGPWGITPPGHFLYVSAQVMQDRGFSFIELARAFALLGMTQCDASINAWHYKYTYDILRPETAIRHRAPQFNNSDPRVVADPGWTSLIPTPEFPAYTSGHSTFGAVGAHLTALLIGTDNVTFQHESPDLVLWPMLRGRVRRWTSLSQAADENGMSRIYGGVHWIQDHNTAMRAGKDIAEQAFTKFFPKVG